PIPPAVRGRTADHSSAARRAEPAPDRGSLLGGGPGRLIGAGPGRKPSFAATRRVPGHLLADRALDAKRQPDDGAECHHREQVPGIVRGRDQGDERAPEKHHRARAFEGARGSFELRCDRARHGATSYRRRSLSTLRRLPEAQLPMLSPTLSALITCLTRVYSSSPCIDRSLP